ncbi:MAG: anhydro-N-acetylmuramic acid kinase [Hyphomicrobiales bacterium]|nr:anhydro-N-acetylmuramic acid kinase [Hyphomicrobiales bacterium]MDE2115785.1 anhydro-N-acetylmuramic acid kinase [Hyphomicrobiales bacterium]
MTQAPCYIGIMSGTSMDGVDAVLARFDNQGIAVIASVTLPFVDELRAESLALNRPGDNELGRAAVVANQIADLYAATVTQLLRDSGLAPHAISAIGAHGQTVRHRPDLGYSLQLLNGARLAEKTGITTICDFRSGDIAAGGHGAPLVPAFHTDIFGLSPTRVILNLGGIANISLLAAPPAAVIGYDTGPANLLLDYWHQTHRGGRFDNDGAFAASGSVIPELLEAMLRERFFHLAPPKSTGRDLFSPAWLHGFAPERHAPQDVQATLLALTVESAAAAIRPNNPGEVLVCGGGALNGAMMAGLRSALAPIKVASTLTAGVDPMHVEALAFAWLAKRRMEHAPGNLPAVTGALGPRVLGAIYSPFADG